MHLLVRAGSSWSGMLSTFIPPCPLLSMTHCEWNESHLVQKPNTTCPLQTENAMAICPRKIWNEIVCAELHHLFRLCLIWPISSLTLMLRMLSTAATVCKCTASRFGVTLLTVLGFSAISVFRSLLQLHVLRSLFNSRLETPIDAILIFSRRVSNASQFSCDTAKV